MSETPDSFRTEAPASADRTLSPWNDPRVVANHRRRKALDLTMKIAVACCIAVVLVPLGDLLYTFAYHGFLLLSVPALTASTLNGGVGNAIEGTLLLIGLSSLIAVPIGIFGGVYMAEFSGNGKFAGSLRFAADVLAGVPSIVLGYVGYLAFVIYFGWNFSALAASLTLSILMFPYIFRTTELALRKVPASIREGAIALGSTKTTMINRLVLRFAIPGILTGVLLSISIGASETAPLLYTASFSNYFPTTTLVGHAGSPAPIAYLTDVVYLIVNAFTSTAVNQAYFAAFLLILIILTLNIVARVAVGRFSKI
jgi:phosphate transport system permease protein